MEQRRTCKSQMEAARSGEITAEVREAARFEGIEPALLRDMIASGTAALPANRRHLKLEPRAVGRKLKTKINVNMGTSRDIEDAEGEIEKVRLAEKLGAHALMDLSSTGDTRPLRRTIIETSPLMIGTVPAYDTVARANKPLREITSDDWIESVRLHAEDGVDFQTIHAGLTKRLAEEIIQRSKTGARLTGLVSRGGSLLFAWMAETGKENPYYERFDEVLAICAEHEVTVSLGDSCRPGSTADSSDGAQIGELIVLGDLVQRARKAGVQTIVEGPGHMALDEIEANMAIARRLCGDAPFYVLGPLTTDIAPGYDHITAAIGGAVAAAAGAAFLCYVTPAEHLRLPTLEDVREGIIASVIAAHSADIAKGVPGARDRDDRMSRARQNLDWEQMFTLAVDPEKACLYRSQSEPSEKDSCTMCGKLCAVRNVNRVLSGEASDVL